MPPDLASCRKVRAILNRSGHDRNSLFQSCLIFFTFPNCLYYPFERGTKPEDCF
ncbi:hypothetical protein BACCOP_01198 [Phocaeicola coprocola DSM 17136]|uniref:Uncharacterized protein n=1 Tax=Phocaeicola coprocola DSM 17136 TaxID=470145 RepID=B3JH42_9BACT|nr:hypothetical protein BACCOP_01198 [Phocaeicola coprocola DSM 17136]